MVAGSARCLRSDNRRRNKVSRTSFNKVIVTAIELGQDTAENREKVREPQGFFLAFEMGNLLDSRSSDLWCAVFIKGENEKAY